MRGFNIIDANPSGFPSRNMLDAHMKTLRFYRKVCRLVLFDFLCLFLSAPIHFEDLPTGLPSDSIPSQSQRRLLAARKEAHQRPKPRWPTGQQGLRAHVPGGTAPLDWSSHSEVCGSRSNSFSFSLLGSPGQKYSFRERQRGYSYLEEKQYKGKSKFLKEFYIGERPNF